MLSFLGYDVSAGNNRASRLITHLSARFESLRIDSVLAVDSLLFGCSSVLMGFYFQLDSGKKGKQEDAQACKQACSRA